MTDATQTAAPEANKKAESKVETVKLTDGRLVDFAGKRRMLKESLIDDAGAIAVRIDFRNGQTRTFTLNPALMAKFAAHGAEQKYGDETAGLDDVEDMILAVDELHTRLTAGEWSQARDASGLAGTSVLARALAELKGLATPEGMEKIKLFLKGKTQAEKVAMRSNPQVKPIIERIEAERVSKGPKVDTTALLGELDNVG